MISVKEKPLAQAAHHYLAAQLAVVEAEEAGIRDDEDPECLHRFRVALRRSRALLGELKDCLVPELAEFRHRLAAIARGTNACRDADVFLALLPEWSGVLPDFLQPGLGRLEAILRQRRQSAHAEVMDLLQSAEYRSVKQAWHHWLAQPAEAWFVTDGRLPLSKALEPRIRRRLRKLRRRLAAVTDETPAQDLHRLRIQVKKLRYLLEFQAAESDDGRRGDAIAGLKRLQNVLGRHHDAAEQFSWLRAVLGEGEVDPETAAAVGWLLADRHRAQRRSAARLVKKRKKLLRRWA